jgi:peptide/nickel transport system permease protein
MSILDENLDTQAARPAPPQAAPKKADRRSEESQWRLMVSKFMQHKLAVVGLVIVCAIYFISIFAEFFAPYQAEQVRPRFVNVPPQALQFVDEKGELSLPFVYGLKGAFDDATSMLVYKTDPTKKHYLRLFAEGSPYSLFGIIPTNIHLFGVEGGEWFVAGTDRLGRDGLSRIIVGGRISTSIGLIGVTLSLVFGIIIGGISGYRGGLVDGFVQRVIDFMNSIPTLPLWMALSAAMPANLNPLVTYFGITVILSLIGWTGVARVTRTKFISIKNEDFVLAARLSGASPARIIRKHMLPSFASHLIAITTLAIPAVIIGETSLSFLGLGLRAPVVSWGVLLQEAQNIRTVALYPWLLLPGAAVIVTVLAFNFMGDGLRDAADPYTQLKAKG